MPAMFSTLDVSHSVSAHDEPVTWAFGACRQLTDLSCYDMIT